MIAVSDMSRIMMYVATGKSPDDFYKNTTEKFTLEEKAEIEALWKKTEEYYKTVPEGEQVALPTEWV